MKPRKAEAAQPLNIVHKPATLRGFVRTAATLPQANELLIELSACLDKAVAYGEGNADWCSVLYGNPTDDSILEVVFKSLHGSGRGAAASNVRDRLTNMLNRAQKMGGMKAVTATLAFITNGLAEQKKSITIDPRNADWHTAEAGGLLESVVSRDFPAFGIRKGDTIDLEPLNGNDPARGSLVMATENSGLRRLLKFLEWQWDEFLAVDDTGEFILCRPVQIMAVVNITRGPG